VPVDVILRRDGAVERTWKNCSARDSHRVRGVASDRHVINEEIAEKTKAVLKMDMVRTILREKPSRVGW
jgi:hypothetical protein